MGGIGHVADDGKNAPNKDSKLLQQRLPAWQPLMTPGSVIPGFLLVGAAFIAIGSTILSVQSGLKKYGPIEYGSAGECSDALLNSPCYMTQHNIAYGPNVATDALKPLNPLCVPLEFADDTTPGYGQPGTNVCQFKITLDEDWSGPVYLFYTLTNFYQNHRLYVSDRADNQLTGANSPSYGTLFTDLKTDLPYQGCSGDVLPGTVFCTGTDESAWVPISSDHAMGQTKSDCEAAEDGGHVPPVDNLPAASGVWCPCVGGVWGDCSADMGPDAAGEALYAESQIAWPTSGTSCANGDTGVGYSGYDDVAAREGQCWAQFCNPCGRMARSLFTDKFSLSTAAGDIVPWEATQPFPGELDATCAALPSLVFAATFVIGYAHGYLGRCSSLC